jgi:hypothetical protein
MAADQQADKPSSKNPTTKPGHLPVNEVLFERQGAASPFGEDQEFPLPVAYVPYTHRVVHRAWCPPPRTPEGRGRAGGPRADRHGVRSCPMVGLRSMFAAVMPSPPVLPVGSRCSVVLRRCSL